MTLSDLFLCNSCALCEVRDRAFTKCSIFSRASDLRKEWRPHTLLYLRCVWQNV